MQIKRGYTENGKLNDKAFPIHLNEFSNNRYNLI